jgi:hypothetical protein
MTTKEINNGRNEKGVFFMCNDVAGWEAISRDGINMIMFYEGKYTFSANQDVYKYYTINGFSKRVTQLLNRGY